MPGNHNPHKPHILGGKVRDIYIALWEVQQLAISSVCQSGIIGHFFILSPEKIIGLRRRVKEHTKGHVNSAILFCNSVFVVFLIKNEKIQFYLKKVWIIGGI